MADAKSGDMLVSFTVNTPAVAETTKSVITGDYFETGIRSILILIAGEDGSYKKVYKEATSGFLSTGIGGAVLQLDGVNLKAKYQRYDIYAFVNMGDVLSSIPKDASGKLNPASFAYRLPDEYADLGTRGMPMCAQASLEANELGTGGETRVRLTLRRLMAKVMISVSKSGMTGENAGVLNSSAIRVRQVPRFIRPFAAGGSRAATASDLYGGVSASTTETDYFVFSAGAGDVSHTSVTTLYVPENCQGAGTGSTQEDKAPSGGALTGRHALSTYLEYTASKVGTGDGLSGDLTYKAYLGENEINDYNVAGDKVYRAALNLSWNGLFFDGDWRVDNSDITDGRRLYLSTTANAASSFTDWGHLRRNVASELYVNFSRDGGASWVHSAKDIDGWPYGWDLYIDGVKQAAGASATAAGDLGWAYTSATAGDQIAITPGPSSVASSVHTLQVKSADGRVVSNEVTFEVSQPLTLSWKAGVPAYVAQKGALQSLDLEDPSASVSYSIKEGEGVVKLSAGSDGQSRMVSLVGPGTATIHAECAATGQDGDITITVLAPTLSVSQDKIYCNPDGQNGRSGVYGTSGSEASFSYKTQQGTVFSQRSASAQESVTGNYLDASLYEQYLNPVPQTESPLLGTSIEKTITTDLLHVWCRSLSAYPREQGAHIADVMLLPVGGEDKADTENSKVGVYSVDPFINFPSSASLSSAYDVHDVSLCSIDVSAQNYTFTTPTVYAATAQIVVKAMVSPTVNASDNHDDAELATSISYISRKLSWSNKISTRTKSTGGPYSISLTIKNRYSGEALDKEVLKGRLFMHGCIGAEATNSDGLTSQEYYEATGDYPEGGNMYVRTAYFGAPDKYSLDGLGCAYPDVGTNQVEKSHKIEWTDVWGNAQKYIGSVVVRDVETERTKLKSIGSQVFWVEDGCEPHNGSPQWVHEFYGGYPEGDAKLYFYNADLGDNKYSSGKITILDSKTARLRPDNSQSTDGNNGYYYLHLSDVIVGRWL